MDESRSESQDSLDSLQKQILKKKNELKSQNYEKKPVPNRRDADPKKKNQNFKKKENFNVKRDKTKGKKEESFEMYSKGYKTVPCEFYLKGNCNKGDDCKFRHDVEQKPLDLLCKFFLAGSCHNSNCLYLHDKGQYPCKFLHISGRCERMADCNFSHARFSSKAQIEDFIKQNLDTLKAHRDKGVSSVILKYAIECGFVKETAEAERQQITLIPPGLYDDNSSKSEDEEGSLLGGGPIDENKIQKMELMLKATGQDQVPSSNNFLFMP